MDLNNAELRRHHEWLRGRVRGLERESLELGTCADCLYWQATGNECRRSQPTLTNSAERFPPAATADWCGEWQPNTAAQASRLAAMEAKQQAAEDEMAARGMDFSRVTDRDS